MVKWGRRTEIRFIGQMLRYTGLRKKKAEVPIMRGYYTAGGYYGLVEGRYRLFATEEDYYDSLSEE